MDPVSHLVLRLAVALYLLRKIFPQRRQLSRQPSSGSNQTSLSPRSVNGDDGNFYELKRQLQSDDCVTAALEVGGEPLTDSFVRRWLAAKKGSILDAVSAIRAHAAWRAAEMPLGRVQEDEVKHELEANKAFLQGFDNQGRPVLVILAMRHDMSQRNIAETKRFICYILDACSSAADLAPGGPGKLFCLFDLSGLRMRNLDVHALKAIFEVLQGHYPERLACLWFLNAPTIFWGLWRVVSPFIHPDTRDKIRFVSSRTATQELLQQMPGCVLPKEYGGACPLKPVQAALAAGLHRLLRDSAGGKSSSLRSHPLPDLDRGPMSSLKALGSRLAGAASFTWSFISRTTSTAGQRLSPVQSLVARVSSVKIGLPQPSWAWLPRLPGFPGFQGFLSSVGSSFGELAVRIRSAAAWRLWAVRSQAVKVMAHRHPGVLSGTAGTSRMEKVEAVLVWAMAPVDLLVIAAAQQLQRVAMLAVGWVRWRGHRGGSVEGGVSCLAVEKKVQ